MMPIEGDGFSIEHRWKEETVYWEGQRGYLFDGGWGVDPPVLYVPGPEIWPDVVPEWMVGRREEIVGRLIAMSGHQVVDDVNGAYRNQPEARPQYRLATPSNGS